MELKLSCIPFFFLCLSWGKGVGCFREGGTKKDEEEDDLTHPFPDYTVDVDGERWIISLNDREIFTK